MKETFPEFAAVKNPAFTFIVNPISGSSEAQHVRKEVYRLQHKVEDPRLQLALKNLLSFLGINKNLFEFNPTFLETDADENWLKYIRAQWAKSSDNPTAQHSSAFNEDIDLYVYIVVGGDGTLSQLNGLLQSTEFTGRALVVPFFGGRGNDFAKSIYPNKKRGDCAAVTSFDTLVNYWADAAVLKQYVPQVIPIDAVQINGRYLLNIASLGYGGGVVENTSAQKRASSLLSGTSLVYQIEGVRSYMNTPEYSVEFVSATETFEAVVWGCFIGNGKANGHGLYWTPKASLSDGLFDIVWFRRPSLLPMLQTIQNVKQQKPPSATHRYEQWSQATLRSKTPIPIEMDGEFVGRFSEIEIVVSQGFQVWTLEI